MKLTSMALACSVVATLAFTSSAFGEDAYIENTNGNQYFNTGHFVGPHTRIEIDFQLLEVKGQIRPFGVKGEYDANHLLCALYLGQAVKDGPWVWSYEASKYDSVIGYTNQSWNAASCLADLERHKIVLDFHSSPGKFEVWTGETKNVDRSLAAAIPDGTQTYPLGLFASCRREYGTYSSVKNTYDNPAKMRLYSFRIYESGTLVKEFLPWVKGGMAGLKETRSGQFHSGENARACVAGGDVTVEKDDPYVAMPDNTIASPPVKGKSLYFNTSYIFKPTSRIELDYALLTPDWTASTKWSYEPPLFYAGNANNYLLYLMPFGKDDAGCYYYKVGKTEARFREAGVDYAYNVRRKVSASATQMRMETAGFTNFTITSSNPITNNLDSPKLQIGYRSSSVPAVPMKIYGLKIYETADGVETLVRDYRPCISNSVPILRDVLAAPTLGLLPTVYNSPGTNIVCEAGGDIQGDEAAKEAYLDFDGVNGHLIDTEYVVTKDSRIETDFAVWNNTFKFDGKEAPIFFEQRGYKEVADECNGIWFQLCHPNAPRFCWRYADYKTSKQEWFKKAFITNERIKFVFDAPNDTVTSYRKGVASETFKLAYGTGATLTSTTCSSTLKIGGNWKGVSNAGGMRLYNVKIYNSGVLDRNFVPCVTNGVAGLYETCQNRFFPLTGGKVRGKGMSVGDDILVSPQPAKLTREGSGSTATLTCLAAGAQSYEWYEDGVKMEETSDALTLTWTRDRAKSPAVHTYSVKPVYTVFNEKIIGDPVSATVEYTPLGTVIIIK